MGLGKGYLNNINALSFYNTWQYQLKKILYWNNVKLTLTILRKDIYRFLSRILKNPALQ